MLLYYYYLSESLTWYTFRSQSPKIFRPRKYLALHTNKNTLTHSARIAAVHAMSDNYFHCGTRRDSDVIFVAVSQKSKSQCLSLS